MASGLGAGVSAPHKLRSMQVDAYKKVVHCFMQGPYDLAKEEALSTLRQVLQISNNDHLRVRSDVRAEQQQQQQLGEVKRLHDSQGPNYLLPSATSPPSPSVALSSHPAPPRQPWAAGRQPAARGGSKAAAAAGAVSRKRLKVEGGVANKPSRPRQLAGAGAPAEVNPLVGRKVLRYWPRDGGWFDGIISDYNGASGEHCVVYDFGLSSESYEWYVVEGAPPSEFRLLEGGVDVSSLPGMQQAPAAQQPHQQQPLAQQQQQQQQQQQRVNPPAGAARQRSGSSAGGAAAGRSRVHGTYRPAGAGAPAGQRVPVASRPRLVQDWSSEEEEGEEGSGGSAVYSDVSD